MAQPNVVREPSMDEILASIRRIIESNDPIPNSGLATANAEPEGFSGQVANDYGSGHDSDDEEVTLTVDEDLIVEAFEAENKANELAQQQTSGRPAEEPADETAEEAVTQTRPLSLADVAARVRAASERNGAMRDLQRRAEIMVSEEPEPEAEEIELEEPVQAGPAIEPVSIEIDDEPGESYIADQLGEEEDVELEPTELQQDEDVQAVALIDVEEEQQASPLLSPSIGDKVSRSFEDLSAAVHLSGRRTFDEIAAELLRPMLQEWLDDNLPTVVERLVREEIERVARGPRR